MPSSRSGLSRLERGQAVRSLTTEWHHDESLRRVTIGLARPGFQMLRRIDPIQVRQRVR